MGAWFYKRFLRRYKAEKRVINAKTDRLLLEEYHLPEHFAEGEKLRKRLLSSYQRFDSAAIEMNEKYQSVLYWRSILPIITSLIVAVGFYASSVLAAIPIFSKSVWAVIGGFGFLFHGLLNLYVFLIARSKTVAQYWRGMVKNRQMAELLRVIIHFAPFGVPLDYRKLSGGDLMLSVSARTLTADAAPQTHILSSEHVAEALEHVEEMLSDQLAYHSISHERYIKVVEHLERWSKVVFCISFAIVLLRAALQFLFAMPSFPALGMKLGNGVSLKSFITSFANMLALLTPAWYAYFVSKLSLGNYRFNRDNHQIMTENLREELYHIELLKKYGETPPMEALRDVCESLAETMLVKDNSLWATRYQKTLVSHI